MAARLFISRATLWRLERGDPTVALGTLATAAFVLQIHGRFANLAAPATDALALSLDERRFQSESAAPKPWVEVQSWAGGTHLVGRVHPAERSRLSRLSTLLSGCRVLAHSPSIPLRFRCVRGASWPNPGRGLAGLRPGSLGQDAH